MQIAELFSTHWKRLRRRRQSLPAAQERQWLVQTRAPAFQSTPQLQIFCSPRMSSEQSNWPIRWQVDAAVHSRGYIAWWTISASTRITKMTSRRPTKRMLRSRLAHFEVIGRGDKIRTCDPLHPMQVRYQAAPRSDTVVLVEDLKTRSWGIGCAARRMIRRFRTRALAGFSAAGFASAPRARCAAASRSAGSATHPCAPPRR